MARSLHRFLASRLGLGLLGGLLLATPATLQAGFQESFAEIQPILARHCNDCHGHKKHKGGLNFEAYRSEKEILVDLQKWFSVIDQVETGIMPPEGHPSRPSEEEVRKLTTWIRKTIEEFDYSSVQDPGNAPLRRLTKAEYNHTIRDLTGVDLQPGRYFSGDGSGGEGFDNNAEGMSLPPMMVEKYFEAAREVSRHAVVRFTRGISFSSQPTPTLGPRAYLIHAERELTNFYNDFFDRLPNYNPRTEFEPYLMPAMKLALEKPKPSHRQIYDLARERKLMPGVFYHWVMAFVEAPQDIKTSKWNNHYGRWILDPWLELLSRREKVTEDELKAFHDDYAAKVRLAVPATSYANRNSLEVKTSIQEGDTHLRLSVGDMGDGSEFDRVVLHEPKVTLKDGSVVYLGDLEMTDKQGEGAVHRGTFPDGKPFSSSVAAQVQHGLYVEAPALLTFLLPEGAKSFQTQMGLEASADGKGSVQVYASTEEIPFPEGKHTHAWFYRGPGNFAVEEVKTWWSIYAALVGYGKGAGAKEMIDVSLSEADQARLEAIRQEIVFAKREPIQSFFSFIQKKKQGHLLHTREGELPALSDLPMESRLAPESLSESDRQQWNNLCKAAEAFQADCDSHLRKAVLTFAERAFRRPVPQEDADSLIRMLSLSMAETDDFQRAGQLAVQSILTHPRFLFRMEEEAPGNRVQPVDDYAMASRLSYFLWSSMPDPTLLDLAREGRLQDDQVLESQVRRMLKDPKSISLAREFASQWLGFRKVLVEKQPDTQLFPTYTRELRDALYQEAVLAFDDLVKHDRSVLEILDSKATFLNETLAKHYGIPDVQGPEMRRVELKTRQRGGFPTMGSVLVATSWPERTSPVIRGKWVLDTLIGGKVPPPPEGIQIDLKQLTDTSLTQKQRLAAHSTDPNCAVCHDRIDPLGFTLENFDAIGRFRERDGQLAVDSTGQLKGGPSIAGVAELKDYLLNEKREAFLHQMSQKLLGFALGRSLEYYDENVIRQAVSELQANDHRFSTLAVTIARSYPFKYRREKGHLAHAE